MMSMRHGRAKFIHSSCLLQAGLCCVVYLGVACSTPHNPIDADAGARSPVGAPCVPADERNPLHAGFGLAEANITEESNECASGVCIVNHFQGRVTCPYGQTEDDIQTLSADSPRRCRVALADGDVGTAPVSVPVHPQRVTRRASDVVICSCRCAGPDANAHYCACPSGTVCTPFWPDLGLADSNGLVGSYCIKAGTEYDATAAATGAECSASSSDPTTDCGNGRANP